MKGVVLRSVNQLHGVIIAASFIHPISQPNRPFIVTTALRTADRIHTAQHAAAYNVALPPHPPAYLRTANEIKIAIIYSYRPSATVGNDSPSVSLHRAASVPASAAQHLSLQYESRPTVA